MKNNKRINRLFLETGIDWLRLKTPTELILGISYKYIILVRNSKQLVQLMLFQKQRI